MMEIQHARTVDGIDIAFWSLGSGPALFVIPSLFHHHLEKEWQWQTRRKMYDALAKHVILIRFDSRGLGMSQRDAPDYSPRALASDINAVATQLGLPSFSILAERSATPLAIYYAAARRSYVERLILWEPRTRLGAVHDDRETRALLPLLDKDWHLYHLVNDSRKRGWTNVEEARESAVIVDAASNAIYATQLLHAWENTDVMSLAATLNLPTLLLYQERNIHSAIQSRALASLIRGARARTLKGDGMFLDHPKQLISILEFLQASSVMRCTPEASKNLLSEREQQIIELLASPLTTKEIAKELRISLPTLERHKANIYKKLEIHSRLDVVFQQRRDAKTRP